MARELAITVTVGGVPQATAALGQVDTSLKGVTTSADKASTSTTTLQTNFGKFVAAAGGVVAFQKAFSNVERMVRQSVDAFGEQELASKRLVTALQAQGNFTPAVIAQYEDLAQQFQRTTRFSDDLITEMQALLVQVGNVMPGEMEKALTAATNLASGLDVDLRTAVMLIGKAFEGETGTLKRYGIVIDEARLKADPLTAVLEAINQKFGGQAQAALDTYTGKVDNLTNRWDDFQERVGNLVVSVMGPLLSIFEAMPGPLQTVSFAIAAITTVLAPLAIGAGLAATAFGTSIPAAFGTLVTFITGTLVPAITGPLTAAITGLLGLLTAPVVGVIAVVGAVVAAWYYWEEIGPIVEGVYNSVKTFLVDNMGAILRLGGPVLAPIKLVYDTFKSWDQITAIAQAVYTGVKTWLVDRFAAVIQSIKDKVDGVTGFFKDMYDKVIGQSYVPDLINGIAREFGRLDEVMVQPTADATGQVTYHFRTMTELLDELASGLQRLAQIAGDSFGGIVRDVANVVASLTLARKSVESFQSARAQGDLDGQAVSAVGMATSFVQATGQGSTAARAAGGALVGAEIGSMFGPLGTGIGAAIGGLTGLIRGLAGVSEAVKATRGEQDKLVASFRAMGASGTDFEVLSGTISTLWKDLGRDGESARLVLEGVLDTDHPERYAAALQEVNAALAEQKARWEGVQTAVGALNAFTADGVGELGRYNIAADSAVAIFGAWVKKTGDVVGALHQIGPALDQIAKGQKILGLEGSAAINQLLNLRKVTEANKPLMAGIAQSTALLQALGKAGLINSENIIAFGQNAVNQFTLLKEATGNSTEAMVLMQPQLQALWEHQQKFGAFADQATQNLLDQAAASGIVGEEMKSDQQQVLDVLKQVRDVLYTIAGIKIPDKTFDVTANVEPIEIPDFPTRTVDLPDFEAFHKGGLIRRNVLPFLPRAHSGLAIDERIIVGQTGEGILSRGGMQRLGGPNALNALNSGRGTPTRAGGDTWNITIQAVDAQSFRDAMKRKGGIDIMIEEVARNTTKGALLKRVMQGKG